MDKIIEQAVVFGAAGGIGAALVAGVAAGGRHAPVYAGARRLVAGEPPIIPFTFDLAHEATIAAAATLANQPTLVIVATGVLHDAARGIAPERSLKAIDGTAMAEVLARNTIGPALIAKHLLPRLPRDRRSVFAVLSARVGSLADNRLGGWHSYRASKAALNMLVTNFAIEMRRTHPEAIVVALHPGTVATPLSAPFQGNVQPAQLLSPEVSAGHLLRLIDRLTPADSGGHFAWDGARIAW